MKRVKTRWLALGVGVAALTGALYPLSASAQDPGAATLAPTALLTVDRATTVDVSTAAQLSSPAAPAGAFVNRPTVPMAQYRALKQAAAGQAPTQKPTGAQGPHAVVTATGGGLGQNQGAPGCNGSPPDSSAAAGNTQLVQALNCKIGIYTKAAVPALVASISLATLMGYTAQTLFDPRVMYDDNWDRWVITAEAFPQSSTIQVQCIAISTTSNANGTYNRYCINIHVIPPFTSAFFWDYPNLGMNQDGIVMTANVFNGNSYAGAYTFGVAKSLLYNGLGWSVPVFGPLTGGGTTTPAIVVDQNPTMYLVQERNGSQYGLRAFNNPGNAFYASLGALSTITAPRTISTPPNARQPGCTATSTCALDTSDTRFESQTWQYADNTWATHTIRAFVSFPTPEFLDFDNSGAGANTVKQSGLFFFNGSSDDWSPSIAARQNGDVYLGFNSSMATPTTRVQQVVTGRKGTDAVNTTGTKVVAATSTAVLTGNFDSNFGCQRWGDYSNVWPDNSTTNRAWNHQEFVTNAASWSTRFAQFQIS